MFSGKPCVTIGLPIYNGETYVREAIDSILNQTFADFELVISDNASTDQSEAICRDYVRRDPRIRYDRLEVNQGACANFNRLIGMARGKYFKWQAADDICLPTYLEKMVPILESEPQVAWCHSQFGKIDQHGNILSAEDHAAEGLAHSDQCGFPRAGFDSASPHRRFRGVLIGTTWCGDAYGLFRQSVLLQTNLLPACYGAEKVLIGEVALRGEYREYPETLFYQRVHAMTASSMTSREQQLEYVLPAEVRKKRSSARLQLLKGHFGSVRNVPMSTWEKLRSYGVVMEYLCQFSKWTDIFRTTVLRKPIRRSGVVDSKNKQNSKSLATSTESTL